MPSANVISEKYLVFTNTELTLECALCLLPKNIHVTWLIKDTRLHKFSPVIFEERSCVSFLSVHPSVCSKGFLQIFSNTSTTKLHRKIASRLIISILTCNIWDFKSSKRYLASTTAPCLFSIIMFKDVLHSWPYINMLGDYNNFIIIFWLF